MESLVLWITKSFRDSKLSGKSYTWQIFWGSIRARLSGEEPCILFENLSTMVRPQGMHLDEWTNAFPLATNLCELAINYVLTVFLLTDIEDEAL